MFDIVERLRRGKIAYVSESGPVYAGPSLQDTEAADEIERLRAADSPAVAPVAVSDATEIVFGILWPQQEWNGEEGFCQAVAEKVVRTLALSSIIPATKGGEDRAVETMARALHALDCYDSAEDYRREKQPVPDKFADPWLPTGIRQLEILRRRAAVLVAALAQDTDGVAKP